jgi:hypothetical protein
VVLFLLFTNALADLLHRYSVVHHSDTHFPFLAAHRKPVDNQIDTRLQAARDGALMLSSLTTCTSSILVRTLTATRRRSRHGSTSPTTETIASYIQLHWREVNLVDGEVYYRTKPIESAHLDKLSDVTRTWKILYNYLDYAMRERLKSIKAPLARFGRTGW